jgi:FKBP-type peptidyl-prolyl cis-trans isomerase
VTLETVNDCPAGLKLHDGVDEERCPYCNQVIAHEKLDEIRARIEAEERERLLAVERELNERFGREKAQFEAKAKGNIENARKEAAQKAEQQIKQLKATQEAAVARAKTDAVAAEQAKQFKEKQKIQEHVQELERQLQKKTANELGEGAEIDLFVELRREFPGDNITRVKKGVHEQILHMR